MRKFAAWAARLTIVAVCSALPIMPALAAEPAGGAILVLGKAPAGANEAQAREAAVNEALRQAVGRASLELADPSAVKGRLEALEREVLAKAPRFVTTFSLQASARAAETQTVLVAVSVDKPALDKALTELGLRASAPAPGGPAVLALVSEEAAPNRPPVFWWSEIPGLEPAPTPVAKALAARKHKLLETKALLGRVPLEMRQAALNEQQALDLGRKAGAALVILGRVRTYPLVTPAGETPAPVAQLQVLDVASGQALATVEEAGPAFAATPGPEGSDKVAAAVEAAARTLLEQAAAAPRPSGTQAPGSIAVEVSGLRSLAEVYRFEEALGSLPAVAEFKRESMAGGKAVYQVRLNTSAARLAEEIKALALPGLALVAMGGSPEGVKVVATPKP